uniref:Uncharacterized protein n=1 Tax=Vespula pensylvanica TaxID=30213 RepID=A0A834U976_VESPE|nr:hypothetical protein H0235_008559 [Vespula pensylvanica]
MRTAVIKKRKLSAAIVRCRLLSVRRGRRADEKDEARDERTRNRPGDGDVRGGIGGGGEVVVEVEVEVEMEVVRYKLENPNQVHGRNQLDMRLLSALFQEILQTLRRENHVEEASTREGVSQETVLKTKLLFFPHPFDDNKFPRK